MAILETISTNVAEIKRKPITILVCYTCTTKVFKCIIG